MFLTVARSDLRAQRLSVGADTSVSQCNWEGWLPPSAGRLRLRRADPLTAVQEAALRDGLTLKDKVGRDSVVRRLSVGREERTVDALLGLLATEPVAQVRQGILRSLGRIGNVRGGAAPCRNWLGDSSSQTRAAAVWALGQLQDDRSLDPILNATHDAEKHVRDEATWALGLLGRSSQGNARLQELLRDAEPQIRQAAQCGLDRLAAAPASPGKSERPLVIRHVTLIDGKGGPAEPAMTVIVQRGRIYSVVGDRRAVLPRGAEVVDARGQYLVPGLWDMHVHLTMEGRTALAMYLANGITGVRDMGGSIDTIRAFRRDMASKTIIGPRILTAGPYFESPESVKGMRLGSSDTMQAPPDRIAVADAESAAPARRFGCPASASILSSSVPTPIHRCTGRLPRPHAVTACHSSGTRPTTSIPLPWQIRASEVLSMASFHGSSTACRLGIAIAFLQPCDLTELSRFRR